MGGYDTYAVTAGDGRGGCCFNLGRVILMFITVLTVAFTIGTLAVSSSALYNIYSVKSDQPVMDRRGLVQLWLLVAGSALGVLINICGFVGALFSNRRLLLIYACVTAIAVGLHLVLIYMRQWAAGTGQNGTPLNITDDPHSIWTVEMNAYAAEEVLRRASSEADSTSQQINQTMSEIRSRIMPDSDSVRQAALRTVNNIQAFFKCCGREGVEDYISENVTVPESCCISAELCEPAILQAPRQHLQRVRAATFSAGCGPFLHAAHSLAVAAVAWLSYLVAGSQLCGAAVALCLALCCMR